jgi:hypothetical protein
MGNEKFFKVNKGMSNYFLEVDHLILLLNLIVKMV